MAFTVEILFQNMIFLITKIHGQTFYQNICIFEDDDKKKFEIKIPPDIQIGILFQIYI